MNLQPVRRCLPSRSLAYRATKKNKPQRAWSSPSAATKIRTKASRETAKAQRNWDGGNCQPAPFFFVLFVSFVGERSDPRTKISHKGHKEHKDKELRWT